MQEEESRYIPRGTTDSERRKNRERSIKRLLQELNRGRSQSRSPRKYAFAIPDVREPVPSGFASNLLDGSSRTRKLGEEPLEDVIERMLCKARLFGDITIHDDMLVNGASESFGYDDVQLLHGS